jgi:uncharacterized protein involved in response to NO
MCKQQFLQCLAIGAAFLIAACSPVRVTPCWPARMISSPFSTLKSTSGFAFFGMFVVSFGGPFFAPRPRSDEDDALSVKG